MYYIYKAQITNDQGEVQAAISASSLESLEEQLHKLEKVDKELKAEQLESVPDEPYEEQRDDEETDPERFFDVFFEEQREGGVDHYEETLQNIELNNQSLTS